MTIFYVYCNQLYHASAYFILILVSEFFWYNSIKENPWLLLTLFHLSKAYLRTCHIAHTFIYVSVWIHTIKYDIIQKLFFSHTYIRSHHIDIYIYLLSTNTVSYKKYRNYFSVHITKSRSHKYVIIVYWNVMKHMQRLNLVPKNIQTIPTLSAL